MIVNFKNERVRARVRDSLYMSFHSLLGVRLLSEPKVPSAGRAAVLQPLCGRHLVTRVPLSPVRSGTTLLMDIFFLFLYTALV